MGQKLGKCSLRPAAEPFANLPRKAINHIWQVFNDIADGFGLSVDELVAICTDLKDEINVSRLSIIEKTTLLFDLLDTDKNGLIDALEFMATMAAISGMRLMEVVEFILNSYDFDGTNELSVDEVTLALKSVATGLCKLCAVQTPREETVEQMVSQMFSEMSNGVASDDIKIRINVITTKIVSHPDVRSWYSHFGNTPQVNLQSYDLKSIDKDFDHEYQTVIRQVPEFAAYDWNMRNKANPADQVQAGDYPWISSVAMLTPLEYSNQEIRRTAPDDCLAPVWVYGYQAEQSRNNLRYDFQGNIVYNTGKHLVVYNFNGHKQVVFSGHTQEVVCLALHPERQLVASGESGPEPAVIVWHTVSREVVFKDRGYHKNGISCVQFSMDGALLAAVGNDVQHRLTVHRWADNELLFSSDVDTGTAMACAFLPDGTVAVGGDAYLYYWSTSTEGHLKRRGNFSRYAPKQPITVLAQIGGADNMVAGTAAGNLCLYIDRNCVRNVKGHEGTVNALYASSHGLLSGGRDCRVRLWTAKLEPGATFDMSSFGFNPSIRSACLSHDGSCILVGTKGSNVFEVSSIDGSDVRGGAVVNGHSWGKLNCMNTHPSKHEFLTVGDDKRLRVWDMKTKSLLKMATFDADVIAVAYSPVGDQIALGLGGDPNLKKCGAFVVLNEEDMAVLHEARDSAAAICLTKYSPEGETLAVGAEDGAIFLYSVLEQFELIGKCVRHTHPILELDFSADGEWIRSNSAEEDIQFFNADDASLQSNLPAMRDVVWNSWTCPFAWHVKAAHRTTYKGERITTLHTPNATPTYVAVGTNYGYIKLHSFPCVPDDSECHRFPAHVGSVASCRFSFDETHMVSAGRDDRTIIQWRAISFEDDREVETEVLDLAESDDYALEVREGSDLGEDIMPEGSFCVDSLLNAQLKSDPKDLASTPANDVWYESIVPPVNPPKQRTGIPDMSLQLQYVYGYTSQGMRSNIRYTEKGEVVFVASTLGINMARGSRAQTFYQRHTDAITSFACTKDGAYAATGQMGHEPFVAVWDTTTCKTLSRIPDYHDVAVSCMSFSNNGKLLATCGLDADHTISVYEWRSGAVISRCYGGSNHIFALAFDDKDLGFTSCGVKDIKIWYNFMSKAPSYIKPQLGSTGALQPYLCAAYFTGNPIVGTLDGNIYMFAENTLKTTVKAHDGSVSTMHVDNQGTNLVTGGKDGAVRIWNVHLECTKEITITSIFPDSPNPGVKSVAFNSDSNNVIIGTRGSEILEVAVRSGQLVGKPLLFGHGVRELWGLASHPTKSQFITCGDDRTIRLWNANSFSILKTIKVDTAARTICYSPDGKYICVGFGLGRRVKGKGALKEGAFTIMQAHDLKIAHEGKDSNEPLRVSKFTPNSQYLAIGSEDGCIYVYDSKDFFARKCSISVHKAPVMYLDFTADGQYLMSVDSTNRISFSEVATGVHIPSPVTLREEKWATWSSPVGWPVQGMWISQPKDVSPYSVQRSWAGTLLACGTTGGRLNIVHNPCPARAGFVSCGGHSGPISQVAWLAGDGTIVTTGSKDHCILQWKCVFDEVRESGDEGGAGVDSEVERDGGHEFPDSAIVRTTDNFGQVAGWLSAIAPPSNLHDDDNNIPNAKLSIDFVHGPRFGDARGNLFYNDDGHIVFVSSTFGVVHDRDSQEQRVYDGHDNALISLAVDKSGRVAASGELHECPQLHVWDAMTARYISKFTDLHRRGISSLRFSNSGEFLVSLGQDVMHSVVVLRSPSSLWRDGFVLCSTSVSPRKMLFADYIEGSDYPIVVGGNKTIYFFRNSGKTLERKRGTFGKQKKIQPILCGVEGEPATAAEAEGQVGVFTGTVSGHIYVWEAQKVAYTVTAHDAPIYAIVKLTRGYATAAKDGMVKLWTNRLQLAHTYNIMAFKPTPYGIACHSLCMNKLGSRITVGMRTGELFEIALPTHSRKLIVEGHSYRELHALDCNPVVSDEYATLGDDGTLRVWSYKQRWCLRRLDVEAAGRALCYSPDGTKIVVGLGGDPTQATKDGAYMVIDNNSLEILIEDRKAKLHITDIRYSPDGKLVAMAAADGKCYLHDSEKFAPLKTLEIPKPNSVITRIDFAEGSDIVRLSTDLNDLYHYKLPVGDIFTAPLDTRDVKWATNHCPYTWNSQGFWRPATDNINVLSCVINHRRNMAAVSYQNGDVRLYTFPCQEGTDRKFTPIKGIATQCHRMCFSCDGSYLVLLDTYTRVVLVYTIQQLFSIKDSVEEPPEISLV